MKHTNTRIIKLTPEYLYNKGKECYQRALEIEFSEDINERKDFNKVKGIYVEAIIYFQGAMFLDSKNAYAFLSEIYGESNHLGINNKKLSNLIKTLDNVGKFAHHSKLRDSVYLKDFGIKDYSEYEQLAIIESGYIAVIQGDWLKNDIPEYLIFSVLKTIIEDFNTYLPSEYYLITNESIFEGREVILKEQELKEKKDQELINEFVVLNNTTQTQIKPTSEILQKQISYDDEYTPPTNESINVLGGPALCTIS